MSLREELDRLGAALHSGDLSTSGVEVDAAAAASCIVVIPAGGFGYRMRGASEEGAAGTQKSLLPLPNGETLIGRVVRQYAEAGFRRFVALVNYEGKEVETHLANGDPWGVEVRVSYDPESGGSGRTGAMLHAMELGILPANHTAVVHNADCQVLRYPGSFPADLLRVHYAAVRSEGAVATLAAVDGQPSPYTGMSIRNGQVTSVAMYPFLPVPAHTGITILAPEAVESIRTHGAQSKKNFESDFFARWATEGRLAALTIRYEQWMAVDDRKTYRNFCTAVANGEAG